MIYSTHWWDLTYGLVIWQSLNHQMSLQILLMIRWLKTDSILWMDKLMMASLEQCVIELLFSRDKQLQEKYNRISTVLLTTLSKCCCQHFWWRIPELTMQLFVTSWTNLKMFVWRQVAESCVLGNELSNRQVAMNVMNDKFNYINHLQSKIV